MVNIAKYWWKLWLLTVIHGSNAINGKLWLMLEDINESHGTLWCKADYSGWLMTATSESRLTM